jgi:class 3 adenylate cyclase
MTFFGMNLIGPSMIIYASMMYYVNAFQREHNKSEKLLLNILPSAIADRLKQKEEIIADGFEEVTILFADIVNFTKLSARISPNELVTMLNKIFSAFDRLAILYGLEKIKTIGDAYMVVGGLPLPRDDHAEVIADMALNMQEAMKSLRSEIGEELRIRIGINTGSVVAGVIGIQKFSYDLWGDAVNTASRMESQGLVNCIQLTETTYKYLKDKYVCKQRGFIEVKGKGKMKVYLLKGKIPGTPSLVLDAV